MKKLLMCSAAIALGLTIAAPARADGIKLDLAGHFKGYVVWLSQHNDPGVSTDSIGILRSTEIHFTGETTLDNGLTVGVHHEASIDNGDGTGAGTDAFLTRESYAYFSGAWGRVNFGKEDGANYLLEVAAPSADENFDGLRQYVQPINFTNMGIGGLNGHNALPGGGTTYLFAKFAHGLDYADDASGDYNKITYLTPVFSGFQFGASFTPDVGGANVYSGINDGSNIFGNNGSNSLLGLPSSSQHGGVYGRAWEGSGRYEGQFQNVGVTLGGGYTDVQLESTVGAATQTNFHQWNLGADVTFGGFGLGGVYTQNNSGLSNDGKDRTWVGGVDYTTGPFKLGASYLNDRQDLGTVADGNLDTSRWAGGVVYTYGPGMTFRGSIGYVDVKPSGDSSVKATDLLLGTQINF